jgi:ATP-binding cassette subfamily F protein uup
VVINGKARHVASYMKDFLFLPEQRLTPVRVLSGGERARLLLARALAKPSNVLVLDEPTNDLDLETLDLLQEMLFDYPGTVLLVSHDRDFLDRVVTSVIAPSDQGAWLEYAGGYSDMAAQRAALIDAGRLEKRQSAAGSDAVERASDQKAIKKLSFKEKHLLDTLPGVMTTLEAEIAILSNKLAQPGLFAKDRSGFDAASARLAEAQRQLDAAETQWLQLDEKRAALDPRS